MAERLDPSFHTHDLAPEEVAGRVASAKKRGHPTWLWPDMDLGRWRAAMAQIVSAARSVLVEGAGKEPMSGDSAAIGLAAYTSGMGPLLGLWIERGKLAADAEVGELLALHLKHNRKRMNLLSHEADKFAGRLAHAGITPIFVKGFQTAFEYFPEPGARVCSDIDIVVRAHEMAAAEQLLEDMDYVGGRPVGKPYIRTFVMKGQATLPRSLVFVHAGDPWSIDLHSSLDRHFSPTRIARLDGLLEKRGTRPWSLSPGALELAQPLLTLHLAAHASHGLASLSMARLVELALVIRLDRRSGRFSWEALLESGRTIDGLAFIYPALHFLEKLVPGTVPEAVRRECERALPTPVRRMLARHDLTSIHRVGRWSLREHFAWSPTISARLLQLIEELRLARDRSPRRSRRDYLRTSARRVVRAAIGV